ncbi:ADP-ribosyltransferase, partial [Bacillus thuringiensis]|nr:ADP-ribosyltransferase [Bacillus thuringiensis]
VLRRNATYRITKTVHVSDDSGNPHDVYTADLDIRRSIQNPKDFKEDIDTATQWGKQEYKEWEHNGLTLQDKKIVEMYTKNAQPFNEYLREQKGILGKDAIRDQEIKQLDEALNKASLSEDLVVYRGVDPIIFDKKFVPELYLEAKANSPERRIDTDIFRKLQSDLQKTSIKEYGYLSTSITSLQQFSMRDVILEMNIPKGMHAGYVDPISQYGQKHGGNQLELLLPRSTEYVIRKMYIVVGKTTDKIRMVVDVKHK